MPYRHRTNTYHKVRRANKARKIARFMMLASILIVGYVALDWFAQLIRSQDTIVSSESSATVQSAQINIFQTPYYKFQADESWREVTDELSPVNVSPDFKQYLYRSFDKNIIEHELWVTVNMPEDFTLDRHNVPTRILPVRIEADGTLTATSSVSEPCYEALPDEEKENFTPRVIEQEGISYFCSPNQVNDYFVAVGTPEYGVHLPMKQNDNSTVKVTITYRNITANPESRQLRSILSTFRSL